MFGVSLLALLVLVVLGIALAFGVLWRSRRATVPVPVCGKCSYAVQGLPSFTCPECGSDLREVGIVTPTTRRPLPPLVLAIIWTLILPVPALVVSGVTVALVPLVQHTTMKVNYFGPHSGEYVIVDLVSHSRGTAGSGTPAPPSELTLSLRRIVGPSQNEQTTSMKLDIPSNRCTYSDPSGKSVTASTGLTAETLGAWMAAAGVDLKDPKVQTEITEIRSTIQSMLTGSMPTTSPFPFANRGGGTTTNSNPPGWLIPSLAGFWLLIWILGIVRISRKPKSAPA